MRKTILYMMGKNMLCMSLILLIASIATVPVSAHPLTKLYVDPLEYTFSQPGSNVTIAVNVTDLDFLLKGFEFKMWYNSTILDCNITTGDILVPYAFYAPIWSNGTWNPVNNSYAPGVGRVFLAVTLSGTLDTDADLINIHFTSKQLGNDSVRLNETELVNNLGEIMEHEVIDTFSVTVIPEFPAAVIVSMLLSATLVVTFLGKKFWSMKRKDAIIAE